MTEPPIELMPTELLKDGWVAQDQVYQPGWWLKRYWESTEGSHRDHIIKALECRVGSFDSVLELGCNTGPNLRRIHQRWPRVALSGMDIHAEAIRYGRVHAAYEGWEWAGYVGDLRALGDLGLSADVVLSCYSLYVDPRDINTVLAAALACAKKALILCEPMVVGADQDEIYVRPSQGVVPEYHYNLQGRVARLPGAHTSYLDPITPPHQRLQYVLTVLKG